MRVLSFTILIFLAISPCNAAYYFSIGQNEKINTTVVVSGGGENYGFKSLEEIMSQNLHLKDPALNAFIQIANSYKDGSLNRKRIDFLKAIGQGTNFSDILINLTIFDGHIAIILSAVKQNDGTARKTVTCLAFDGTKWTFISGFSGIPEKLIALATIYVSKGKQLTKEIFENYIKDLESLDGKINLPVMVRLTDGPGINSFAFFTKNVAGKTYDTVTAMFNSMFSAYNSGGDKFLNYWDEKDAQDIKKIIQTKGAYGSLSLVDISVLSQCSDGYEFVGISHVDNGIIALFVFPKKLNKTTVFFLKETNGQYKFTRCSMLDDLSVYMSSFFISDDVGNTVFDPTKYLLDLKALIGRFQRSVQN